MKVNYEIVIGMSIVHLLFLESFENIFFVVFMRVEKTFTFFLFKWMKIVRRVVIIY